MKDLLLGVNIDHVVDLALEMPEDPFIPIPFKRLLLQNRQAPMALRYICEKIDGISQNAIFTFYLKRFRHV